jgi:signal transduction histidine kinase
MNNTKITNKQDKYSFPELIFLLDPFSKELICTNRPIDFETMSDGFKMPSFLKFAEDSETGNARGEWEKSLELQPGQSRYFSCKIITGNVVPGKPGKPGKPVWIDVHPMGVKMEGTPGPCILFSVRQASTELSEEQNKLEQLTTTIDNFKKEYVDFIDFATHDMDAPLRKLSTFISKLTSKLSATGQTNDIQEYIVRIEACIGDMRSLIDDLSMLARIILKKEKHEPCNIEDVIRKAIEELQPVIKEKKAIITIPALPVIEGDAEQYKQLFKHLFDNAIKFSKKDIPPQIEIRSSELTLEEKEHLRLEDDRHYFKIEISDNGIGFKQDYAEKIFQPFIRIHGKSQFGGNGIGLAVCKRIIDNHGGIIYAKGSENSGASFTLILPQTAN